MPDPMLAGAGAADRQRKVDHRLVDRPRPFPGFLVVGRRMKKTWKLPSPTWPRMGANRPACPIAALARGDGLGQREIGTQTSVTQDHRSGDGARWRHSRAW
jgi:hypothetical protein